jgi:hypothetical protein
VTVAERRGPVETLINSIVDASDLPAKEKPKQKKWGAQLFALSPQMLRNKSAFAETLQSLGIDDEQLEDEDKLVLLLGLADRSTVNKSKRSALFQLLLDTRTTGDNGTAIGGPRMAKGAPKSFQFDYTVENDEGEVCQGQIEVEVCAWNTAVAFSRMPVRHTNLRGLAG